MCPQSVAGSWILAIDAQGGIRLYCILNRQVASSSGEGGEQGVGEGLPDTPDIVEVVAPASWASWKASSLGLATEGSEHWPSGAEGTQVGGVASLSATGFFDPRGVGLPAEISECHMSAYLRQTYRSSLSPSVKRRRRDRDRHKRDHGREPGAVGHGS